QHQRPDDRVSHPASRLADRLWHRDEEFDVNRPNPLADDEEQHQSQWHECGENRCRAETNEQRRDDLATAITCHAAAPCTAGSGVTAALALRAILQMRRRDNELMANVMMKSTRPISTRAFR